MVVAAVAVVAARAPPFEGFLVAIRTTVAVIVAPVALFAAPVAEFKFGMLAAQDFVGLYLLLVEGGEVGFLALGSITFGIAALELVAAFLEAARFGHAAAFFVGLDVAAGSAEGI